ncbi:MAG TPA: hemerythrin domain-containing protein [Thermoleophilia bacterium]|jgi:hemerythrin superfamily protein|nr:hemerythrin domain-containing protein [Thermoleophilia bacterium]
MGHGADLTTELASDHRLLEMLVREVEAEKTEDGRSIRVRRLINSLGRHLLITERYLYPALRLWAPDGASLAEQGGKSLDGLARAMGDLSADGAAADRPELVSALTAQLDLHIQQEEGRLIPALADAVTWHVLEDLGDKVRAARQS